MDPAKSTPTNVRYGVLTLLCALSFVLYVDRICISQAAESIQRDLDLSATQIGLVFGAFTVSYALFELPTGRWGDRYGSRKVLLRIVLWWSAFTALTGCVQKFSLAVGDTVLLNSFVLLLIVRFLFGAGEAGALPNVARVLSRWFPPGGRGPAQGLISTAALVGGALAPAAAAYLIRFVGWRWSFVVFGSLGVVWAAAFACWFRDDPAEHPGVNEAERRLIQGGDRPAVAIGHASIPWGHVFSAGNFWLLGTIMTLVAAVSYFFFSWYPKYLQAGRNVSSIEAGWLASLCLAGGAVGSTLGGFLCDWLTRWTGERAWTLRAIASCALVGGSAGLLTGLYIDDPRVAAGATALGCFALFLYVPVWWAVVTDISGNHLGALFGLMNSMGLIGAGASQVLVGIFVDWRASQGYVGRAQWDPAFFVFAGLLVLAAFAWLFVDCRRSAVGAEQPPADEPLAPDWRRREAITTGRHNVK